MATAGDRVQHPRRLRHSQCGVGGSAPESAHPCCSRPYADHDQDVNDASRASVATITVCKHHGNCMNPIKDPAVRRGSYRKWWRKAAGS